jgi:ribonucleoside-diphosphate reductase alpha chain
MLPQGGSCNLGSINLTQFLDDVTGLFNFDKFRKYAGYLVRFLDNVNDYTNLPLPEYLEYVRGKRRIGCGILGWGSLLYMMKIRFGSTEASELRDKIMKEYSLACHEASIDLAAEKGMFDGCIPEKHLNTKFISSLGLSPEYQEKLLKTGIRNSAVMSCQPTGNTSILANVTSGGIEPIFMPEYIRTVIVPVCPDEIKSVTPRYWEGVYEETALFKWTKEGDEDILRGVHSDGTVYKIDRNRGLTREVPCEDYGVRWLKDRNEWNPSADWAIDALSLTVKEHVDDMVGFARWIDSAISKTINVPFDYPYEEFTKVYLDAYRVGFIKGVTTYRAGTMTAVLSAKDEKTTDVSDEEIILQDVKLPDSSPAVMKILRAEGKKWYVTVLMNDDQTRPIAFFVHTNHVEKNITTNNALEQLFGLAESKGIPSKHIEETKNKISSDNNPTKIARAISLLLRHGVLIKNIVATIEKVDNIFVGSFLFQIKKFLSSYIRDGEKAEGVSCSECGSDTVVFQEGCFVCKTCGSSKCG